MLRVKVNSCIDKWRSVYIGRNYFTRAEQRFGPRKRFGTHTPQGYNVVSVLKVLLGTLKSPLEGHCNLQLNISLMSIYAVHIKSSLKKLVYKMYALLAGVQQMKFSMTNQ